MSDEADEDEDLFEEEEEEPSPAERYYVNRARTLPGPFDLTIDLGYLVHPGPVEWLARISLSWEEARILQKLIDAAVEEYQRVVGPIRDIEGIDPPPGISGNGAGHNGSPSEPDEEDPDD